MYLLLKKQEGATLRKRTKAKPFSLLSPMVSHPLRMRRHQLSRRSPRKPRFRKRKDELSDSQLERKVLNALTFYVPEITVEQQYKFHDQIAWRFDFCYPEKQIAIEMQGYGVGHASYQGMKSDYTKHNAALLLGWRILYFMSIDIEEENIDVTISIIREALGLSNANQKKRSRSTTVDTLRRRLVEGTNI